MEVSQTSMKNESQAKKRTIGSKLIRGGEHGVPSNIKMERTVNHLRIASAGRVNHQVRNVMESHSSILRSILH